MSLNAGAVVVTLFVTWFGYGFLVLISRNCCPVSPKINMFYRAFIITFQLFVLCHLSYAAINSLLNSSLTEGENPINVCIGIFLTVYLTALVIWMWILGYQTEVVEFDQNEEEYRQVEVSRMKRMKEADFLFELDNKTFSSGDNSLNETQKSFESSRSNLEVLPKKPQNKVNQRLGPSKEYIYQAVEQRYLT